MTFNEWFNSKYRLGRWERNNVSDQTRALMSEAWDAAMAACMKSEEKRNEIPTTCNNCGDDRCHRCAGG